MDSIAERSQSMTRQFGEALRLRRRELGLTLEQLALAAGVNRRFIGELERGKPTCEIGRAFLVAAALGYAPGRFLAAAAPSAGDDDLLP